MPFVEQTNALSIPSIQVLPDDTIRKKYKFGDDSGQKRTPENNQYKKTQITFADVSAILGFGFAILSIVLLPFLLLGLIFSLLGLKSNRFENLARLGLRISLIVIIVVSALLLLIFLLY